jgi:polynucleotide 5'-kinase involved in rRNA processing
MLPLLMAVAGLVEIARRRQIRTIIYDTTGLIDPGQGGVALKLAKIGLLRPENLIAIRRRDELEPIIAPLRRSSLTRLIEIEASTETRRRMAPSRQRYRAARFAEHFAGAHLLHADLVRFPALQLGCPMLHQLLAFEDAGGNALSLGISARIDRIAGTATILTPINSLDEVKIIRSGDVIVDPETFRHSCCRLPIAGIPRPPDPTMP